MTRRIAIVQGHPDRSGGHLCHALAEAYAEGAREAGHTLRVVEVAALDFPLLRSQAEFEGGTPVPDILAAQETIRWAEHLVFFYPLWLGGMPALLKGFLEQALRPGFAFGSGKRDPWSGALGGRSARIVVTMGMPALAYRWLFRAHSLKSFERNVLRFCGIGPIGETLFGGVETVSDTRRKRWLSEMSALGRRGV